MGEGDPDPGSSFHPADDGVEPRRCCETLLLNDDELADAFGVDDLLSVRKWEVRCNWKSVALWNFSRQITQLYSNSGARGR